MKSHDRVVVIGGGVVGSSVLYHLAKLGWSDVCLIERSVLTAGSSWHAAGGIHALNADPNIAALQAYTIDLLPEIEKESGQNIGLHMTGGLTMAAMFVRHGYAVAEADIRARVLYYQQIGYYALDLSETLEERLTRVEGYLYCFSGAHPTPAEVADFAAFARSVSTA